MFFRRATDGTRQQISLENLYAGPTSTACWIIGGGPSLARLDLDRLVNAPAPRFTINLAGSGLFRPHFWTSYDPTARFHRSIYLDPSVTKFVHSGRAMDLVPETTFKVCECPALYLIERETQRGFHDFPGAGPEPVTDWQDSLIQAIEIAYRLGFRQLYLAGCEMVIRPSPPLLREARRRKVFWIPGELLGDFVRRCEQAGLSRAEMEKFSTQSQYHFDEKKSFVAALQTDAHYFRIAQTLRLCRRSMALAGLQLTSVTPRSRLNAHFPVMTVAQACRQIEKVTGNPRREQTHGRYSQTMDRRPANSGPMRDVSPHFWPAKQRSPAMAAQQQQPEKRQPDKPSPQSSRQNPSPRQKLQRALEELPEVAVRL